MVDSEQFSLSWTNLHYSVVDTSILKQVFCHRSNSKKVKILNGVSGHIKSGQMMGIMGASGSGKTILMGELPELKSELN